MDQIKHPADRARLLNALIGNEVSADSLEYIFFVMDAPLSASTIKKWRRANAAWKELHDGQPGSG